MSFIDSNTHSRDYLIPNCIFGDGCLLKLTDDIHNIKYTHLRSLMPKCIDDPDCTKYLLARNFIMNGGPYDKDIKIAQNHVSMYYHSPIYSSVRISKPNPIVIGQRLQIQKQSVSFPREENAKNNMKVDLSTINTHTESAQIQSGGTEINDMHTVLPAQKSDMNIPKLKFISKSLPSSPVSKFETLDTPKMMTHNMISPCESGSSNNSSPKHGIVKTPKSHSKRDRDKHHSNTEEKISLIQTKIDTTNDHIKTIQDEIGKLKNTINSLDHTQHEMKDTISELRDQFIKLCLDE